MKSTLTAPVEARTRSTRERASQPAPWLCFLTAAILGCLVFTELCSAQPTAESSNVVRVSAQRRDPDFARPWRKHDPSRYHGTGVLLDDRHVLTAGHTVKRSSAIYVQPPGTSSKQRARLLSISLGIDLALLELDEPIPLTGPPLMRNPLEKPALGDSIQVYGFPIGGQQVSTTKGVVSRIEYVPYYQGVRALRIQVDAALNAGNSGGPAFSGDRFVGLVFSSIRSAENIGYLIPVQEVARFLACHSSGKAYSKPQFHQDFRKIENDALRDYLGLEKNGGGVLITEGHKTDPDHPVKQGDVVTKVNGTPIDLSGKVLLDDGLLVSFEYMFPSIVEAGQPIRLTLRRDRKEIEVVYTPPSGVDRIIPFLGNTYPRYFVFGPMVFSQATQEFCSNMSAAWSQMLGMQDNPVVTRRRDAKDHPDEELVVVTTSIAVHPITNGYRRHRYEVVDRVNGIKIRNLRQLAELLAHVQSEFVSFDFMGRDSGTVVLRVAEVVEAEKELFSDWGLTSRCSDDLLDCLGEEPSEE